MNGTRAVTEALAAYLTETLPGKLDTLRGRDQGNLVAVEDVPDPQLVQGWEPETHDQLDLLPMVFVTEVSTEVQPMESTQLGSVWRTDNRVFLWCFVAGPDYGLTQQARQMYTLAVRELLLGRPGFAEGMRVVTRLWREDHSDITPITDRSMIGGVRISVTVRAEETLTADTTQMPVRIGVTPHILPPIPVV